MSNVTVQAIIDFSYDRLAGYTTRLAAGVKIPLQAIQPPSPQGYAFELATRVAQSAPEPIIGRLVADRALLGQLCHPFASATNLSAAVSLLPMTRTLLRSRKSQVREAHHLWFVTFLVASSFAVILFFIDGLHKLLTGWMVVNSPLFVIGEVSASIYLLALAILFGPDRFLYWIYYPSRLLTYRKLKRLADRIQRETGVQPVYTIPLPRIPTHAVVELATWRWRRPGR